MSKIDDLEVKLTAILAAQEALVKENATLKAQLSEVTKTPTDKPVLTIACAWKGKKLEATLVTEGGGKTARGSKERWHFVPTPTPKGGKASDRANTDWLCGFSALFSEQDGLLAAIDKAPAATK